MTPPCVPQAIWPSWSASSPPEPVEAIGNLPERLRPELSAPANLRTEGEDGSVIFAGQVTGTDEKLKLLAPVGALVWEQRRVPLDIAIQKAEGVQLGGWHKLSIQDEAGSKVAEYDWFGVGTYLNLSDAEALNNGRFERQQSGLRMDAGVMQSGELREVPIQIELIKLPQRFKFLDLLTIKQYVSLALAAVLSERAGGATPVAGEVGVAVAQEAWNHHSPDGAIQNRDALNAMQAFVATKQGGGVALPAGEVALDLTGVL